MKINIDELELYSDKKYYRVAMKVRSHTFHSEKLNYETASELLSILCKSVVKNK